METASLEHLRLAPRLVVLPRPRWCILLVEEEQDPHLTRERPITEHSSSETSNARGQGLLPCGLQKRQALIVVGCVVAVATSAEQALAETRTRSVCQKGASAHSRAEPVYDDEDGAQRVLRGYV